MSCHPQAIRQSWLFPRCFSLVWVRWVAPPRRETVLIAQCCHLSPVRALINILLPINCKPDYLRFNYRHPLNKTTILITPCLYLRNSDYRVWLPSNWPFYCLLSWVLMLFDYLVFDSRLNKRQRLCLTLVCAWFLEWYVAGSKWSIYYL